MDPHAWSLSDIAIRRPVTTAVLFVALAALGVLSLRGLGTDLFPAVSPLVLTVDTPWPGAGSEEIETLVTRPIEDALGTLPDVETLQSTSREGSSVVVVRFGSSADTKLTTAEVRDRILAARQDMPSDVSPSELLRLDPGALPLQTLVLRGEVEPRELRRHADRVLRPALEQIPGVGAVEVRGGAVREIGVELYAERLSHYGVSVAQVSEALAFENVDVHAGRIAGDTNLRMAARFRTLEQLGDVVVSQTGSELVRVRDVAEVVDHAHERRTLVRFGGSDAVAVDVRLESGADTLATASAIQHAVAQARAELPTGWALEVTGDSAGFVRESLRDIALGIVFGGLAVLAAVLLFTRDWRASLVGALALSVSVLGTFCGLALAGFTLNTMTLMGLALAIGLVIDDAVVVRESILRQRADGADPLDAASHAVRGIAPAVLAATAAVLAAALPTAFVSGASGPLFRQFGGTVAIAVSLSALAALTLSPTLSARMGGAGPRPRGLRLSMDEGYGDLLRLALQRKILALLAAAVAVALTLGTVGLMGSAFVPGVDRGRFVAEVLMPPGTPLDRTSATVADLEQILLADPDVLAVHATIGEGEEARRAELRVEAADKRQRRRSLPEVMEDVRRRIEQVPGIRYSLYEIGLVELAGDSGHDPLTIEVRGPDPGVLQALARSVADRIGAVPGVVDPDTSWTPGAPELRVEVDREEAYRLGVSAASIGTALRSAIAGETPTRFHDGDSEWDVRVRLREFDRNDRTKIEALPVPTRVGSVPLRQVARLVQGAGPSAIEHRDRQPRILVSANVLGRSLGEIVRELEPELDGIERPKGYSVALVGAAAEMHEVRAGFLLALGLAVLLTYGVLASRFESFVHPLTVMATLPLAGGGALLGLFLAGSTLDLPAFAAILMLVGLASKNGILLVDHALSLRDQGLDTEAALLEAGRAQLRPILTTAAAISLGVLPSALGQGPGSEFRAPMAVATIGGVVASTALTLVVAPALYALLDRFTVGQRARRRDRPTIRMDALEPLGELGDGRPLRPGRG